MRRLWLVLSLVPMAMVAVASCVGEDEPNLTAPSDGAAEGSAADAPGDAAASLPVGPVVTEERRSGSRLEPNWLTLPDGQKEFVDWWDTELKVHCTFTKTPANGYRCIPKASSDAF